MLDFHVRGVGTVQEGAGPPKSQLRWEFLLQRDREAVLTQVRKTAMAGTGLCPAPGTDPTRKDPRAGVTLSHSQSSCPDQRP